MARIAVVEDEPRTRDQIAQQFPRHDVVLCADPLALAKRPDLGSITHAVIDLSFGMTDGAARERSRNGLDALLLLGKHAPYCQNVVTTSLGGPRFTELARAVQQFFSDTPMLLKTDVDHHDQALRLLLANRQVESHPKLVASFSDVVVVDHWRDDMKTRLTGLGKQWPYDFIAAVASFQSQPDLSDIARAAFISEKVASTYLSDIRRTLKDRYFPEESRRKGPELWRWLEPRAPIFEELAP